MPSAILLPCPSAPAAPVAALTRRAFVGGLTASAAVFLGACGRPADLPGGGPLRFTHAGGVVTLERPASRVVSAGPFSELDVLLALGVPPVGIGDTDVLRPWQEEAGAEAIPTFPSIDGPDVEALLSLRPELALINKDTYTQLPDWVEAYETVCPVVALPVGPENQLELVAAITGVGQDRVDAETARIRDAVAGFAPRRRPGSFAVANFYDGQFYVWTQDSPFGYLFDRLGLAPLTTPAAEQPDPEGGVSLSLERIGELDRDLLIILEGTPGDDPAVDDLERSPVFRGLAAVREGRYARLTSDEAIAIGDTTVLSFGVAVDALNRILT